MILGFTGWSVGAIRDRSLLLRKRPDPEGGALRRRCPIGRCLMVLVLCALAPQHGICGDPEVGGQAGRGADATAVSFNVSVLYATNRMYHPDRAMPERFGGERGQPQYGRCQVSFTPIPVVNRLAEKFPFYVPSETDRLIAVEAADSPLFWEQLHEAVARTTFRSVVVFVHGYNYSFERTCRMAAELQRDLAGAAAVVMFSWPANGRPTDYVMDLADVEWSMPFLAGFLNALGDGLGRENVHLVAHSLGSRGVIQALGRLRADQGEQAVMGRLVLLAPDFDSQTFVERLPRLLPQVARITLYASSNDTPLKASRQLNGYPRLGEAGEYLTVVAGVETIDVSSVGRYQILGHEYFHYHPLVSADLVRLLTRGDPAAQRPGLRARTQGGMQYWEIRPTREP